VTVVHVEHFASQGAKLAEPKRASQGSPRPHGTRRR